MKYYEESIARPIIVDLSNNLYQQFLALSQKEQNPELKEIYDFLTAYRAVPVIFLPAQEEMMEIISTQYEQENPDLSDEQLTQLINQRTATISKTLAPTYQTLIPTIIEAIQNADESRAIDTFLATQASDFLQNGGMEIYQNYTMFQPRSHYTDSSFLKTYFIAMKWLMREKFYFQSPNLVKSALVMVNSISEADKTNLDELSLAIKNLIGSDDDLSIDGLLAYAKTNNLISPEKIVQNLNEQHLNELSKLLPQKIQSTSYKTPQEAMSMAEADAKSMTDGFVFFGEKFTLDSSIFDIATAGSAEKEFAYKPNLHTALIVPDVLENSDIANQFVKLWLSEKESENKISEDIQEGGEFSQLSSYDTVKAEIISTIASYINTDGNLTNNIYHKWLKMIGRLLAPTHENDPYFMQDPLYKIKNLITYMSSYTELKHDTLLYVKQSFAEMGGAGGGECDIMVDIPALPVPKGYIEANPDFLEQLIQLNKETAQYFPNSNQQYNFQEFENILKKFKEMSIQQQNNKTISDENFERMRLLESTLTDIVRPQKLVGLPTRKEMRAAIIADIFTSEADGPLYEAVGRPALLFVMVNDINGARVVAGPVFTHYEFYESDKILNSDNARYTDEDRQHQIDGFSTTKQNQALSLISRHLKQ